MAHFTVIGLGRFGITASIELNHLGHTVTGLDKDERLVEQYASALTQALICDVTDERTLRELNLCQSEAVLVAIGEDMQASLICTLHLKNLGVKDIWVKANTSAHPMISDYLSVGHGNYIVDIQLPNTFEQATVEVLIRGFENSVLCLLLKRGEVVEKSPDPTFEVCKQDTLILYGPKEALVRIAPRLT